VQVSATSQTLPPVAPPAVVAGCLPDRSAVLEVPLQWSAPSQAPPVDVPVQLVVTGATASAGQAPLEPVQFSATSQTLPPVPRHSVVAGRNPSTHVSAAPLQ